MPHLEAKILAALRATGGAQGGLTAEELGEAVFETVGRVRMTLRRLLEREEVYISGRSGPAPRYLPRGLHRHHGGSHPAGDFGWGRDGTDGFRSARDDRARADMASELSRLQDEVDRLSRDNQHLRDALTRRSTPGGQSRELHERLDVLIQLCHPDRHDNSDRANDVTRWLLALRQERRRS
jgi:hypothetical protein